MDSPAPASAAQRPVPSARPAIPAAPAAVWAAGRRPRGRQQPEVSPADSGQVARPGLSPLWVGGLDSKDWLPMQFFCCFVVFWLFALPSTIYYLVGRQPRHGTHPLIFVRAFTAGVFFAFIQKPQKSRIPLKPAHTQNPQPAGPFPQAAPITWRGAKEKDGFIELAPRRVIWGSLP